MSNDSRGWGNQKQRKGRRRVEDGICARPRRIIEETHEGGKREIVRARERERERDREREREEEKRDADSWHPCRTVTASRTHMPLSLPTLPGAKRPRLRSSGIDPRTPGGTLPPRSPQLPGPNPSQFHLPSPHTPNHRRQFLSPAAPAHAEPNNDAGPSNATSSNTGEHLSFLHYQETISVGHGIDWEISWSSLFHKSASASEEIWAVLNIVILRAYEGEAMVSKGQDHVEPGNPCHYTPHPRVRVSTQKERNSTYEIDIPLRHRQPQLTGLICGLRYSPLRRSAGHVSETHRIDALQRIQLWSAAPECAYTAGNIPYVFESFNARSLETPENRTDGEGERCGWESGKGVSTRIREGVARTNGESEFGEMRARGKIRELCARADCLGGWRMGGISATVPAQSDCKVSLSGPCRLSAWAKEGGLDATASRCAHLKPRPRNTRNSGEARDLHDPTRPFAGENSPPIEQAGELRADNETLGISAIGRCRLHYTSLLHGQVRTFDCVCSEHEQKKWLDYLPPTLVNRVRFPAGSRFWHVEIVPDDATGRRIFSRIFRVSSALAFRLFSILLGPQIRREASLVQVPVKAAVFPRQETYLYHHISTARRQDTEELRLIPN
ncbi:hypothetical protein PR048_022816 [Dryococelus australis]|uniref:Uncharacterized protein n=1 Tax=Dryococelus australis TaxID=614101 RepID=A0ABQ9GSE4_9NEOP|nr:hypothetical protein PR048_022816 [Dryococelus australis]